VTEPSGIRWTGNATWMYRASTEPLKEAAAPKTAPTKEEEKKDKVLQGPRLEPIQITPVKRTRD
jgi:hypothetical protein